MSELKHFSEAAFETDVLGSEKPVLVDFYADWCGPCRMMEPVLEAIAADSGDTLVMGKLDTDEAQGIAMRYRVMSIPTLGLFRDGRMVDRLVGFPGPGQVRSWVEKSLAAAAV